MGSLYRRRRRDGRLDGPWWCAYYADGRQIRETTDNPTRTRPARSSSGEKAKSPRGTRPSRNGPDALRRRRADLRALRSAPDTGPRGIHPAGPAPDALLCRVAPERYRAGRRRRLRGQGQADGVTGSTIRRELSTLTKMLRLAYKTGKHARLPLFDRPKEGVPREGFFELDQYEVVRRHLRPISKWPSPSATPTAGVSSRRCSRLRAARST